MFDSRLMSCAFGGTGPRGGRRSTPSQSLILTRYVRFEAPEGNCRTSISPSGTSFMHSLMCRSTAARSKSSPSRTFIVSAIFLLVSVISGKGSFLWRAAARVLRHAQPPLSYLRDESARPHVAHELQLFDRAVLDEPPSRPALLQRPELPTLVAPGEVQRQPGGVVQAPVVQVSIRVQPGKDSRGTH